MAELGGQPVDDRSRVVHGAANGQPGFACYQRGADGRHHAHAVQVLTAGSGGIARIVTFLSPELVAVFGLPAVLPGAAGAVP
jgi:RNA polymerase sigma-70 factor (ECF subfamily)